MERISHLFLLALSLAFNAHAETSDSIIQQAWKQVNAKDFNSAINTLENWQNTNPENYNIKFLLARSHAWNGNYDKAISILDELLVKHIENSDLLLTKARVLSWKNQIDPAIKLLTSARNKTPDYIDVWKLELTLRYRKNNPADANALFADFQKRFPNDPYKPPKKVKKKQITPAPVAVSPVTHSLLVGQSYETLSNNSPDWHASTINYSAKVKKNIFGATLKDENRFDLNDKELAIQIDRIHSRSFSYGGLLSISSEQTLLPTWTSDLHAAKRFSSNLFSQIKWQHKAYKTITTDTTQLSIGKQFNKITPKFNLYVVALNNQDITLSYNTQLTYQFNDIDFIRMSFSKGEELEYTDKSSIIYQITNYSVDGKFTLSPNWYAIYSISHHVQGSAYNKNGIFGGLQHKF